MRRSQSHLRFVLDNMWFDAIENKSKMIYLITSFLSEEDSENVEILHTLQGTLRDI